MKKLFLLLFLSTLALAESGLPDLNLSVGQTFQFHPTTIDQNGRPMVFPIPLSYSTSDATIATVSTGGLVTGVAAGSVSITATNGTLTSTKTVNVYVPSPAKLVF